MRILIMDQYREVVGGSQAYQRALLPQLARRGHQVAILYEREVNEGRPTSEDGIAGAVASFCTDRVGVEVAVREALAWAPDVIYSQGVANVDIEARVLAHCPGVLYGHNYYGTCATGTKCFTRPAPKPCVRRLGPLCIPLNYVRGCGARNPIRLLSMYRSQVERRHALSAYRTIVVASHHMRAEFERHGVPPERLRVLPCVPSDVFESSAPSPTRQPNGRIVLVGRLTRSKGGIELVRALRLAEKRLAVRPRLLVIGDGPERSPIAAEADRLGVYVEFSGWKSQGELVKLIRTADLLAMPSVWPEPFGLLGIEAGRLGVPCVAYATGGIPDWLLPGVSGELAPGENPTVQGLSDALVRALGEPTHLARLAEGAWRLATERTLKGHVDAVEALLTSVATHR